MTGSEHITGKPRAAEADQREERSSRLPKFYRLPIEQRLAWLARSFNLSSEQVRQLRNGSALRIEGAVNMIENAIGVFNLPLGLGLNFTIDGRDYVIPMAIEEASIIAAVSKAALIIRGGGGFATEVDEPVMIGQVQVLDLDDPDAAATKLHEQKEKIIAQANLGNPRMLARGGGVFELETRVIDGGEGVGRMLVVHLLIDVREAMGANAVNYACEAVGPLLEEITGGRVNLRIVSNLADRRLARARFRMPLEKIAAGGLSGGEVAQRLVEASRLAAVDPYRAATHNKGIFNGIGAAALALGQDWRAIEAGGHAWAARGGSYRGLTRFEIDNGTLTGEIEMPMQVGWFGGAVNSHAGVRTLRQVSGITNAKELAGVLAAVGLAQNFAACLALSTVGIQSGHMALHARSVALSIGVPPKDIETVAQKMIAEGEVKVSRAEELYRELQEAEARADNADELPIETFAPGKVVLFGEHAVVYGHPGIAVAITPGVRARISSDPDADNARFLNPRLKQIFDAPESDSDIRQFARAADRALEIFDLRHAPIAIQIESDVLPGMGLGSSAAFSVALCRALREYKHIRDERWDNGLFSQAQQLEEIFHGHPSGMDAATVLSGGVLWFRRGEPREMLPLKVSEPMYGIVCIVEPGGRTRELVRHVRQLREAKPELVEGIMGEIGRITTDAGSALAAGDAEDAGGLMVRNHRLLSKLGVSTPGLDRAVELLLNEDGVLGAKLTGAGGGGAVVALVRAESQYELLDRLSGRFPLVFPFQFGAED